MREQLVGPFRVIDATATELARVQRVAAAIPLAMTRRDPPGFFAITFNPAHKPRRAPSWAWGFMVGPKRLWVDRGKGADEQLYVIAHEYFHGWEGDNGTPQLLDSIRGMMGTELAWRGGFYNQNGSNRPSEGAADAFARAIGFNAGGKLRTFYRSSIEPTRYQAYLTLLGGGAAAPGPFPEPPAPDQATAPGPAAPPSPSPAATHRPRHPSLFLRSWPGWAAPVVRIVPTGGRITTARGRIGSAWALDGRRGAWWLEIVAVDGETLRPPLWAPERALAPLRTSATRANGSRAPRARSVSAAPSRRSSTSRAASPATSETG